MGKRSNRAPKVLLTATTWWPLSARLAIRLIQHGCTVAALCPRGHVLRHTSGLGAIYHYRGLDSLPSLERALQRTAPDIVIPCDDRAVWQLHDLHRRRPGLRGLIERSLGPAAHYCTLQSRAAFMDSARELGARIPETQAIQSEAQLARWFSSRPGPAVLKLDGTWGGNGVQLVRSLEESVKALRRFAEPPRPGLRWKRFIIDRDPLAFWQAPSSDTGEVSIQAFIAGKPANAMVACWQGEVLGLVCVEVLCSQGLTGASTIVRVIRNDEIGELAKVLTRKMGLSGFFGLDFILAGDSHEPYLIEINARCTQLGHLVLPEQGDLASMLCTRLGAPRSHAAEAPLTSEIVAFFPQALTWNADSPYLRQSSHDVPWSDLGLVRELLRAPWPERRWLARLYRALRRDPHPSWQGIEPALLDQHVWSKL